MISPVSQLPQQQSRPLTLPLRLRIFYFVLNILICAFLRRDGTLNRSLLSLLSFRAPADGVTTTDHVVNRKNNLSVRHFTPKSDKMNPNPPVIVYFHGGGFVSCSASDGPIDFFCRQLSTSTGSHVVSVDYRLAPEHRCPAQYNDGTDVLRWLDDGNLGLDLSAVFITGDSAGGNIAHHVAARATKEKYATLNVVGLVAVQPFFGGETETDSERRIPFVSREHLRWTWRALLPEGATMEHEAANGFGSSGEGIVWEGFPETVVVVGGLDPLQDRQRMYCEGLRKRGVTVWVVEYPSAVHAFQMMQKVEGEWLLRDVAEFVKRVAGSKKC